MAGSRKRGFVGLNYENQPIDSGTLALTKSAPPKLIGIMSQEEFIDDLLGLGFYKAGQLICKIIEDEKHRNTLIVNKIGFDVSEIISQDFKEISLAKLAYIDEIKNREDINTVRVINLRKIIECHLVLLCEDNNTLEIIYKKKLHKQILKFKKNEIDLNLSIKNYNKELDALKSDLASYTGIFGKKNLAYMQFAKNYLDNIQTTMVMGALPIILGVSGGALAAVTATIGLFLIGTSWGMDRTSDKPSSYGNVDAGLKSAHAVHEAIFHEIIDKVAVNTKWFTKLRVGLGVLSEAVNLYSEVNKALEPSKKITETKMLLGKLESQNRSILYQIKIIHEDRRKFEYNYKDFFISEEAVLARKKLYKQRKYINTTFLWP